MLYKYASARIAKLRNSFLRKYEGLPFMLKSGKQNFGQIVDTMKIIKLLSSR